MADAAVEFLLNNLKDLLLYHADLITGTKTQIERLETDLRLFNAFLKDSQRKRIMDETTKLLVQKIRDVVYEVEDVVDAFVTLAMEKKASSSFTKFWKPAVDLHEIGKKVVEVKEKVEQARIDFSNLGVHNEDEHEKPQVRPPRQKDVVGFKDVTEELILRLTKKTDYFDVVSLIGMFGLGKTTLAWKIFNDRDIHYEFPIRIWLSISQEFSESEIYLAILKEFTAITDDLREKGDEELARRAADYLQGKSFFIVMDDVWTTYDWDRLRKALPNDCNNKGKVLITSRINDVGQYACNPRSPNKMRFFNQEESWELLRLEALCKLDCPPVLSPIGQVIASQCNNLPLAIVIIGGILATKYYDSDLGATAKAWEEVSEQVSKYLSEDEADRMNNFISLSYDKLPYHLRACFLYLGLFPEDFEISASKLILMWIGEGFIQSSDSSLEETGEKYLEDLINRNLVRIEKIKPNGKVKACRIHDNLRHFCQNKARDENFLQEIKSRNGAFIPPVADLDKYRRLSIHSNCLKFISLEPRGHRVRSFVCFTKDEFVMPLVNIPNILKAFELLRVLDVKPIKFPKLDSHLFQLVHARYIALTLNLPTLAQRFSKLWNLQTLIIHTTCKTLEVKADIWKLIHLRHFKTNASASLPKPSKSSKHGIELQTLRMISVESCTTELFEQASSLKKLGIRGELTLLLEGKKGSFDSLGRMKNLENLKLINDLDLRPPSDGKLNALPLPYQFPSKLKSLTLCATSLDWEHMYILGLLANLEVLKLKTKAFEGGIWSAVDGGFRRLEFLHIEDKDLKVWTASSHHYPRLRGLLLRNCEKLLQVPLELADITTFQMLELYTCRSAVDSAQRVHDAKRNAQAAFQLSIFPPP